MTDGILAEPDGGEPNPAGATTADDDDGDIKEHWPPAAIAWFKHVKDKLDGSIWVDQHRHNANGATVAHGNWPAWATHKIKGHSDPCCWNHWKHAADSHGQVAALQKTDFCLPNLLFCAPELQFPDFCLNGCCKCKWHDSTECTL